MNNIDNIVISKYAKLHLMGDPKNLYKFEKFRKDMFQKFAQDFTKTLPEFHEEEFNKLLNSSLEDNFREIYDLYYYTVTTLLIQNEKYKVGDWFYIEDLYETRQWHGMGRISFNLEENKKILVFYGEDTPYSVNNTVNINIFPEWLKEKIKKNCNFDKYASEDYLKYLFENDLND